MHTKSLVVVCAAALSLVGAPTALADTQAPTPGTDSPGSMIQPYGGYGRQVVTAEDLYVRDGPAGVVIGTLFKGEHFDTQRISPSGLWCYGFAYGHANKHGWVQCGYLKKE